MPPFRPSLLVLCTLMPVSVAAEFRAGAARIEITPPLGYPMWGYGARHDLPSEGILDPLHARALVLESNGKAIALVSLDLGRAPAREATARIRQRVAKDGVDAIFLVGSHTHHGPVLELATWPNPQKPYVQDLEEKLIRVILEAKTNARPALLGMGSRELNRNRNRHSKRPDPPIDREFQVLRVTDREGKPIAHAVNYSAHPTMQDSKVRKFSADFPGALATLVEKETGAPCLFLQGACGDLSTQAGDLRGPDAYGQALGRETLKLAETIRCEPLTTGTLTMREDDFAFRSRIDLSNRLLRGAYEAAFFPALVEFYVREYREGVRPHLTTALLDGRIALVGASGEFFSGHALSLKRRARLPHVLFLGYCNDYQQYFPTIEAAAEGGYGADPLVSPVEPGAGERMIDRALVNLYKMRGQLPNLPVEK